MGRQGLIARAVCLPQFGIERLLDGEGFLARLAATQMALDFGLFKGR
jgi:hypothetical protein